MPALGHDLVHHDAKAPTCVEVGWEAYDACSRGDYTTYQEIATVDHTPGDLVWEKPYFIPGMYDLMTSLEPGQFLHFRDLARMLG